MDLFYPIIGFIIIIIFAFFFIVICYVIVLLGLSCPQAQMATILVFIMLSFLEGGVVQWPFQTFHFLRIELCCSN